MVSQMRWMRDPIFLYFFKASTFFASPPSSMMAFLLNTSNIKISLHLGGETSILAKIRSLSLPPALTCGNFFVRREKFVHTIFLNGHVNITGIRTFSLIEESLDELRRILKLPKGKTLRPKIDNICSRGRTKYTRILLFPLYRFLATHLADCFLSSFITRLRFEPARFPALLLKTRLGSILLFGSGKFVLVGYRQSLDAHYLMSALNHVLGIERQDHCPVEGGPFLRP